MTRVMSGAVLIAVAVVAVWFAPPPVFFGVAELLLILAFIEYAKLAEACGLRVPLVAGGVATVVASMGLTSTVRIGDEVLANGVALDAALLSTVVVGAAISLTTRMGGRDGLAHAAEAECMSVVVGPPCRA